MLRAVAEAFSSEDSKAPLSLDGHGYDIAQDLIGIRSHRDGMLRRTEGTRKMRDSAGLSGRIIEHEVNAAPVGG